MNCYKNSNPIYSIIIPHRNSLNTLTKCIDSIPDNNRFQVIVVDDCSDNCNLTNFTFNRRYPVNIIKQNKCKGAGAARNEGLKKATGSWILFCDADDYYLPCLEKVLENARLLNKDIVYFNVDPNNNDSVQGQRYYKFVSEYNETENSDINIKYRSWTPWAKLYRRSLISDNNLYFEERRKGNDCFFVLNAALHATGIAVINIPIYHLTYSQYSLSHTNTKQWDYMFDVYDLWVWRYYFYKTNKIPLWKEYNIFYLLKQIYRDFGFKKASEFYKYSWKYKYSYKDLLLNKLKFSK